MADERNGHGEVQELVAGYALGGLTLAILLGYLTYALVKPEQF